MSKRAAWVLAGALIWFGCAVTSRAAEKISRAKGKATEAEMSVEALAASVRPSVVVITHFGRDGKEDGVGAGFVVATNGLIATSLHVIGEARPVTVQLSDGKKFKVTEIYAWDRKLDLAVVRIAADHLPALPLGESSTLKQGTPVVAMGNPLGLEHSIVQGVVSAIRDVEGLDMIQLAIPIEPGNSGGPLLDLQGRVQGLLAMKSAMTPNLGFAVPVSALKPLLKKPNPVPMSRWLTIGALNPREWTPLFGARWSRKAGRIMVEGLGSGFGGRSLCLSQKPVPARPYELAVTVKLDDEAGAAGLVFASDGGDVHYGFYPTGGQLRLTRFDGPDVYSWSILQTVASLHYRPGEWNTIKVRCEPEKIRCYVNNELVIESNDHALTQGRVGLAKFRNTKAEFRDFQVGANLAENTVGTGELPADLARELDAFKGAAGPELTRRLAAHAEAGRAFLSERARTLEGQAAELRRLAGDVHRQSVQRELLAVLSAPEEKIDLGHAALLVARLDNPSLDVPAYRRQLDDLAGELRAQLPATAGDAERLAALRKFLFEENGFHGSRTDYYNRANSYLNEVLDDREGLPITLSVLFLEVARGIGLTNVSGAPLPAHFMVRYVPASGGEQFIDVYDGGRTLRRGEAMDVALGDGGEEARADSFQPARKRDIVIRMLHNLRGTAERSGTAAEALRYYDLILALAPDGVFERLSRARLRWQGGDVAGAREDFKWLLDHDARGVDRERIAEMYRSLEAAPAEKRRPEK